MIDLEQPTGGKIHDMNFRAAPPFSQAGRGSLSGSMLNARRNFANEMHRVGKPSSTFSGREAIL
jgi:hypothetical protein